MLRLRLLHAHSCLYIWIVSHHLAFVYKRPNLVFDLSIYTKYRFGLDLTVSPALEESLQRRLISLESNLAGSLVQVGVGLKIDLARLLVCEDSIADLGSPKVQANVGHAVVQLKARLGVGSALVDVEFLQVVSDS